VIREVCLPVLVFTMVAIATTAPSLLWVLVAGPGDISSRAAVMSSLLLGIAAVGSFIGGSMAERAGQWR
jgi:hypothetical protein